MVFKHFSLSLHFMFFSHQFKLATKLLMLNKWTLVFFDVHFRDVWPDDQFGSAGIGTEEEFMCLCDIFKMPLPNGESAKYALCMIHVNILLEGGQGWVKLLWTSFSSRGGGGGGGPYPKARCSVPLKPCRALTMLALMTCFCLAYHLKLSVYPASYTALHPL